MPAPAVHYHADTEDEFRCSGRILDVFGQNLIGSTAKSNKMPSVSRFCADKILATVNSCSISGESWWIEHGLPPCDRLRSGKDFCIDTAWYHKHGLCMKTDHKLARAALFS